MQVIVLLSTQAARAFRGLQKTEASDRALKRRLKALGVELTPLHGDTTDPELAKYFFAEAEDEVHAQRLAGDIASVPAVEAAYVKPRDEPPGG